MPAAIPGCAPGWWKVGVAHIAREGVAGSGGYCKVGHWASNSLHMCPMMPRRWSTHRSARIAQEQGQSPEFAPLKTAVPRLVTGLGVEMWIVRWANPCVTRYTCDPGCLDVEGTTGALGYGGNRVPAPKVQLRHRVFELAAGCWGHECGL